MPLGLIFLEYLAHLPRKLGIQLRQTVGNILVHGRFGNPKLLCGSAYRGLVLDDIDRQLARTLPDIVFQKTPPPTIILD